MVIGVWWPNYQRVRQFWARRRHSRGDSRVLMSKFPDLGLAVSFRQKKTHRFRASSEREIPAIPILPQLNELLFNHQECLHRGNLWTSELQKMIGASNNLILWTFLFQNLCVIELLIFMLSYLMDFYWLQFSLCVYAGCQHRWTEESGLSLN